MELSVQIGHFQMHLAQVLIYECYQGLKNGK